MEGRGREVAGETNGEDAGFISATAHSAHARLTPRAARSRLRGPINEPVPDCPTVRPRPAFHPSFLRVPLCSSLSLASRRRDSPHPCAYHSRRSAGRRGVGITNGKSPVYTGAYAGITRSAAHAFARGEEIGACYEQTHHPCRSRRICFAIRLTAASSG